MPSSSCTEAICNPTVSTSTNRLTSSGYSYDSAGNTIADPTGRTFVYEAENKQVSVSDGGGTLGEYSYDGDGRRVKKYDNISDEITIFVYDAGGKLIAEYTPTIASSVHAKVAYLTNDRLGSPRINTDANGAVTARHDFHPYGEEVSTSQRIASLGYPTSGDGVRKQFTGYERDRETELDFAQARYFDSSLGRFTAADDFGGKQANPQSLNLYTYVLNNPLKWTDPTGHSPDDCKDKSGKENCKSDENNQVRKPDGSPYNLPPGPDKVVNINGGGGTGLSDRSAVSTALPSSWQDFVPVYGPLRQMAYNMNCRNGGGCNIGAALGNFGLLASDLAAVGTIAKGLKALSSTRNAIVREVVEETTEAGTGTIIRDEADDLVKPASSLYDDSITKPGSIRNIQTDVGSKEFIDNLSANGFARSVSKDGAVVNLEKGALKYSIRPTAVGQKPPSVNVFVNGRASHKIRLKP